MDPLSNALPPTFGSASLTGSYHDFSGLGKLKGQARTDAKSAIRETAQQFEAMFLQQMMKSMRDASFKSDLVESSGKETFEAMFDKEVAMGMARRNSIGLADLLVKHMPDPAAQASTAEVLKTRGTQSMSLHPAPEKAMSLQPNPPQVLPLPRPGGPMTLQGLRHE
jgi:Rod binding domain-containing protein